jgi:alkanesulfonate monooxygenase SsuD/methylene tetrahydromethanopterin reductase-like flavin-dependent oxidoreductase (luciferase family)
MPLVAKHADWWNCVANAREHLEELATLRGGARISAQYALGFVESPADHDRVAGAVARSLPEHMWGPPLVGGPDELITQLRAERAKGVEMFVFRFHDYRRPDVLTRFMAEVAPYVE